jgi:hypothetical protein
MARRFLKVFTAIALGAGAAWAAGHSGAMFLLAAALLLVAAGVFSFSLRNASRSRKDMLYDSTISTLVFPPSSQLQRPPR